MRDRWEDDGQHSTSEYYDEDILPEWLDRLGGWLVGVSLVGVLMVAVRIWIGVING